MLPWADATPVHAGRARQCKCRRLAETRSIPVRPPESGGENRLLRRNASALRFASPKCDFSAPPNRSCLDRGVPPKVGGTEAGNQIPSGHCNVPTCEPHV